MDFLNFTQEHRKTPDRWRVFGNWPALPLSFFWYRQSPQLMRPQRFFSSSGNGEVTTFDPAMDVTAWSFSCSTCKGAFCIWRPFAQQDAPLPQAAPVDWSSLFAAAGLKESDYRIAQPEWTPLPGVMLARVARRRFRTPGNTRTHRRRGKFMAKPIYFDVNLSLDQSRSLRSLYANAARENLLGSLAECCSFPWSSADVFVMRRNLRLRRSDTRGALRLGTAVC